MQLLKNESIGIVSGPWWLIQLWLNLYLHKIAIPSLKDLKFPSSGFAEREKKKLRLCISYGEAASAVSINLDIGYFFKIFYKGFNEDILIWLPYDDEDNEFENPSSFRCDTTCTDELASLIFNCLIKPCTLPVEFRHGRSKTGADASFPSYEFYNPVFVARQFGFGQLSPQLFFADKVKPREDINERMEILRVCQLGSDLPLIAITEWKKAAFSTVQYNKWWPEWHSHLFCRSAKFYCLALDKRFESDGEVKNSCVFSFLHQLLTLALQDLDTDPPTVSQSGQPVQYDIWCPTLRVGSTAPSLKTLMKTPATPLILVPRPPKRKTTDGPSQKSTTTRKRSRRTKPSSTPQVTLYSEN